MNHLGNFDRASFAQKLEELEWAAYPAYRLNKTIGFHVGVTSLDLPINCLSGFFCEETVQVVASPKNLTVKSETGDWEAILRAVERLRQRAAQWILAMLSYPPNSFERGAMERATRRNKEQKG